MRVDTLAITLRPRSMDEAADLGQRLVQGHARALWRCFTPVMLAVLLLALSTVEIAGWLPGVIVLCAKPWLDRTLLFVLSRAVFGQSTRWAELWAARREVFGRDLLATLTLARLSPGRAFTQPVRQLEGQSGAAHRRRCRLLLSGRRWAAARLQLVYAHLELLLLVGAASLFAFFVPDAVFNALWVTWVGGDHAGVNAVVTLVYGLVVLLLEPFYVASGFAMYLNRRVELEAWDIEQELRHVFA